MGSQLLTVPIKGASKQISEFSFFTALPPQPRDLQANNVQATNVTLTWKPGIIEDGEPVTSYIIKYRQKLVLYVSPFFISFY